MSTGSGEVIGSASAARRPAAPRPRILLIDRYRGALVMLMVAGDFLAGVAATPDFLLHAPDVGLTVADTVAPAFVFLVGLTYGPSFAQRRAESDLGTIGAVRHVVLRYFALIGIGAVISAGSVSVAGQPSDWGVLQALGVAGLLCLTVIALPTVWRAIAGMALLIGYQVLLDTVALDVVLASNHGGLPGSLGWASLLILSTVVADIWRRGSGPFALSCVVLVAVAVLSAFIVPVSKHRISLSYVLISLALSAIVLLILGALSRRVPRTEGVLCWWGRNALGLYLLHLVILGFFTIPGIDAWYSGAPFWLAMLQLVGVLAIMTVVAGALHFRGLHWRL